MKRPRPAVLALAKGLGLQFRQVKWKLEKRSVPMGREGTSCQQHVPCNVPHRYSQWHGGSCHYNCYIPSRCLPPASVVDKVTGPVVKLHPPSRRWTCQNRCARPARKRPGRDGRGIRGKADFAGCPGRLPTKYPDAAAVQHELRV